MCVCLFFLVHHELHFYTDRFIWMPVDLVHYARCVCWPWEMSLCHSLLSSSSNYSTRQSISQQVRNQRACVFGKRLHEQIRPWILSIPDAGLAALHTLLTVKWVCISFAGPFKMQRLLWWSTWPYWYSAQIHILPSAAVMSAPPWVTIPTSASSPRISDDRWEQEGWWREGWAEWETEGMKIPGEQEPFGSAAS